MMQFIDADPQIHIPQLLAKPLLQPNASSWFSSTGKRPMAETLGGTAALSTLCLRALLNEDEECILLFGVTPSPNDGGNLWLLASAEAEPALRTPSDDWSHEVDLMLSRCALIVAFPSAADTLLNGWLEELGFSQKQDLPADDRMPIHATYIKASECANP